MCDSKMSKEAIQAQLRESQLKVTVPRLRVLAVLNSSKKSHYSAEDVYRILLKMHQDVGLATIYRVLAKFEQAGLVLRHHFEGEYALFELAYKEHHDHMICLDSHKIIEFKNDSIEEAQKQIAKQYGFELVDHRLVLYVRKIKQ